MVLPSYKIVVEQAEDDDDSGMESRVNPGVVSEEEFFNDEESSKDSGNLSEESVVESVSDGFTGESISEESVSEIASVDGSVADISAMGESSSEVSVEEATSEISSVEESSQSDLVEETSQEGLVEETSQSDLVEETSQEDILEESNLETASTESNSNPNESDEVLNRLKQINNSTVIEDEKYEPIESQINNQAKVVPNVSMENNIRISDKKPEPSKVSSIKSKETHSRASEDRPQRKSSSTLDFDSIFSNPDSQFDNVDQFEHNYEDDFASIESNSVFAEPSDADLMFDARPKAKVKKDSDVQVEPKSESPKSPLDESSGQVQVGSSGQVQVEPKPKSRPIDALANKEELKSTAVVISNDMGSIVGIDEKIYGPFLAKDVVILPNIIAQVLIDNNKAELIDI